MMLVQDKNPNLCTCEKVRAVYYTCWEGMCVNYVIYALL